MRLKTLFASTISAAALVLGGCAGGASSTEPLTGMLYTGFTLIDPATQTVTGDAWVVVDERHISAFGSGEPPRGVFSGRQDMTGLYALPGFIDVHGHLTAGPHAIEFVDGQPVLTIESVDEITEYHARMALAFGVTTVRNPGSDPEASAAYDQRVSTGEWVGPRTYHAGSVIQPPPYGGSAFAYPRTEEEWQAEAARQAALGMTYFKLYHSLTEAQLETGARVAREHGLEPIAHLDQVSWTRAAELGVTGFLHAMPTSADLLEPGAREDYINVRGLDARFMYQWFERVDFDGPLMQAMFATLAESGANVDLTLQVNALVTGPEGFERVYPPEDQPYFHPRTLAGLQQMLAMNNGDWTDEDTLRAQAALLRSFEFAQRLDAAGIPLGIGTDGPGGGPAYATELELMADAGFAPWRILELATVGGATVMGLDDETGRWAEGLDADLVFLRANPLEDIVHARNVAWVMTDGTLHSFEDLTWDVQAQPGAVQSDH